MEETRDDEQENKAEDAEAASLYDLALGQIEAIKSRAEGIEVGAMITLAFPKSVTDPMILGGEIKESGAPPDVLVVSVIRQEYFLMTPQGFTTQLGYHSMRGAFDFMRGVLAARKEMMKDQTTH
jgi:hypothetical protein